MFRTSNARWWYSNLPSFGDHRGGLGVTTLGRNVSSFMAGTGASWHYKFDISSMAMKSMFDMKCRARKSILNFMPLAKVHGSSIVMFGVLQCTGFWMNNFGFHRHCNIAENEPVCRSTSQVKTTWLAFPCFRTFAWAGNHMSWRQDTAAVWQWSSCKFGCYITPLQ